MGGKLFLVTITAAAGIVRLRKNPQRLTCQGPLLQNVSQQHMELSNMERLHVCHSTTEKNLDMLPVRKEKGLICFLL